MSLKHLDYYVEVDGAQQVYGRLLDCEASDAWYLYQYLTEIRQLKAIARQQHVVAANVPRKEKYFLLYALLQSMQPPVTRVAELGSSLLEIIDGLEAMQAVDLLPGCSLPYSFLGIEKSGFLAEASRLLHPNYDITLLPSVEEFHERFPNKYRGIVYDRIVSSSAFRQPTELARFLAHFDAGILNLLTSREDTFVSNFFGANYTYFSLAELDRQLPERLFHLFGFRAPKHAELRATGRAVVEGFFFFGSSVQLQAFVAQCERLSFIREFFVEKLVSPSPISSLI
jgi:hypothetical protein